MSGPDELGTEKTYFLRDHSVDGEWDRLDELHRGIRSYLEGALSFAVMESPKTILDLGAGSGAWAIQAAQLYSDALVIAADIAPLPDRPLPSNITYLPLDILKPYPLEKETFDLIHLRLLLYHVPVANIADFLERTVALLKPGGWLLIEDVGRHWGHENSKGSAQLAFDRIFMRMLKSKGLDPLIGEHLETLLKGTNAFSQINVKREELVLSTSQELAGPNSAIRSFSNALRSTIERIMKNDIGEDLRAAGYTKEMQEAWLEERSDPHFKTIHDFWFTWSQKHA